MPFEMYAFIHYFWKHFMHKFQHKSIPCTCLFSMCSLQKSVTVFSGKQHRQLPPCVCWGFFEQKWFSFSYCSVHFLQNMDKVCRFYWGVFPVFQVPTKNRNIWQTAMGDANRAKGAPNLWAEPHSNAFRQRQHRLNWSGLSQR